DADLGVVAPGVGAELAGVGRAEVEAHPAEDDLLLDVDDRLGQELGLLRRLTQQVEGQPLGRLGADARQLAELFDQAGDRLGQSLGHAFYIVPEKLVRPPPEGPSYPSLPPFGFGVLEGAGRGVLLGAGFEVAVAAAPGVPVAPWPGVLLAAGFE